MASDETPASQAPAPQVVEPGDPDLTPDQLIEFEQALQEKRALHIVGVVKALAPDDDMPKPYWSGWYHACEEIAHRLEHEKWELSVEGGWAPVGGHPAANEPAPQVVDALNEMRIVLVTQVQALADLGERYARRMERVDVDEARYAAGAVAHARQAVAPYAYNGPLRSHELQRLMAMTEAEIDEEIRVEGGDPDEWAERAGKAIESAVQRVRAGAFTPDNPPPLRRPWESVDDYRARLGWSKPATELQQAAQPAAEPVAPSTPSSHWKAAGDPDPHDARYYDQERATLCMGHLTDDELANCAFMNYDRHLSVAEMVAGKPTPLVWMTAVKDRIRWLSRSLEKALATPPAAPAGAQEPRHERT